MDNTEKGDKVLLIGRKTVDKKETVDHLSKLISLTDRIVEFVNFDAMRGKNDWSDYNKCFIIHIPNLPFHNYVYQYLYYTKSELVQEDLRLQKIDTNFGFSNNDIIENLRLTDVVSSIYQGLKRVNRSYGENNKCELYVVTNNDRIQELVVKQFKGLKSVNRVKIFDREYDNSSRLENGNYGLVRNWIDKIWNGEPIRTKQMLQDIGISQSQFDKVKENFPELKEEFQCYMVKGKRGLYAKDKVA